MFSLNFIVYYSPIQCLVLQTYTTYQAPDKTLGQREGIVSLSPFRIFFPDLDINII